MNVEEIMLKLGIRTDSFSQGVERVKAEVTNLAEHVDKSMSAKSGEGLKSLFQELTNMSPMLGNAMKLAFNPIVGGFAVATAIFAYARNELKNWNAQLDAAGARAAKPIGLTKEMKFENRQVSAKMADEFKDWREAHERGPIGSKDRQEVIEQIEAAAEAAGGDKVKFGQSKLQILEEGRAKAEEQRKAALGRADVANAAATDPKSMDLAAEHKATAKSLELQIEESKKKSDALDANLRKLEALRDRPFEVAAELYQEGGKVAENDPEHPSKIDIGTAVGYGISQMIPGGGKGEFKTALEERIEKEKDELAQLEKQRATYLRGHKALQDQIIKDGSDANNRADAVKRAQAEADEAQSRGLELEKEISSTRKQLKLDEREKSFDEEKLKRDVKLQEERIKEERNAPYRWTQEELSKSAAWDPWMTQEFSAQAREDQSELASGSAYGSKYIKKAQELELLQKDAKMAALVDGPNSSRYKKDLERIDSLQKDLKESGLQPSQLLRQKLENRMMDFLDKAEKEGIAVQPKNGR